MNTRHSLMAGILMLLALTAVPVTTLGADLNTIDPDLVGLWHMDGNWEDSSGNVNHGTGNNGVAFSTNRKIGNYSGIFDGLNDYVNVPDAPSLDITDNITIEAWLYPKTTYDGYAVHLINKWGGDLTNTANYVLYYFGTTSGISRDIRFYANAGGVWKPISPYYTVSLNNWYHVVLSYTSTRGGYLYVNGVSQGPPVGSGSLKTNSYPLRFGSTDGRAVFNGLIDEVAIYKRALSATEIQEKYRTYAINSPTVNPVTSPTASSTITLSGTKPANTAIVVNGSTLVPLDGTTTWQASYTLSEGTNNLSITALGSQNFNSLPVIMTVILDTTPPQVTATTPANNGILKTDPGAVTFTLADAFSPLDFTATLNGATVMNASSFKIAGTWSSAGSGTSGTVTFTPASTLTEETYTATIKPTDKAGNGTSSSITFTMDTTPPAVGATPAGGIYNSTQIAVLAANDPDAVIYYTEDGSTPTTSAAAYSQPISIPVSAILKYFARDLAGNNSDIITENFIIDTAPPALAISTLSDGAYTNNEILNIAGTVTDDTGVRITVNDTAVQVNADGSFSYALRLKNGVNSISIAVTDSAGNMAANARTVTLDQTAPILAVTTPADNSKTAKMLLEVNGTVDETSVVTVKMKDIVQSALMNNGAFTSTIILEPGYNTIEITATDLAGNQSSLKRTVVFDDQVPSLAVTGPSQDIRTNQSNLTINGTVSDSLTAVGVTISLDNEILTLPVIDGTFEQAVNFAEERTYGIVVTATNEVGTSISVQRNVIYDITPPVLSIDPVPGQTSQTSLSVSGTREAGTAITVTCTTATVGEVSYPTSTTWLVDISGLSEGENLITAASADTAGNEVTATATIVLETRPPQITITATPDVIWPPNHKMVPVTIAGGVETYGSDIKSVSISVSDEYGKLKYNNLTFGSTVMLEAWRNGNDKDGRIYTITVVVTNWGGIKTTKTATVTVRSPQKKLSSGPRLKAKAGH